MHHLGIDVHKKENQMCILAGGGELIEQRTRTESWRFAPALGEWPRGVNRARGLDRQRVGRALLILDTANRD